MKTVSADFNAMTESGAIRLTLPCSRADLEKRGLGSGDWAWLTDGEVIVGARLVEDESYGLVGELDEGTVLHLDETGAEDYVRVNSEIKQLMKQGPHGIEDEIRLIELTAQWEHFAPSDQQMNSPGRFALCRAQCLSAMGKVELAWLEADEARKAMPDDPEVELLHQQLSLLNSTKSSVVESLRRIGG